MAYVSEHARRRGKQRLGIPQRALARLVPIVLAKGTRPSDYRGRMRRWLDGILHDPLYAMKRGTDSVDLRVYGEHVYLFGKDSGQGLITILNVPGSLRAAVKR